MMRASSRPSSALLGSALAAAMVAAAGCSSIVDFDECTADDDCRSGQRCDPESKGCYDVESDEADAASTPEPTGSAFGEPCVRDAECESSFCAPEADRCTRACTKDADCPGEAGAVACRDEACEFLLAAPLAPPVKVGFLYVGPVADFGWTKTHDEGRKAVEAWFDKEGIDVQTTYEPAVAPDAAPAVIDRMLTEDGVDVVVGTSFDFVSALQAAAVEHREARFLSCSGFVSADAADKNLGSYFGKMQQAVYLAGKMAAKATRSKVIGVIGSVPIPELVRHINAFAIGARQEVPDVEVQVRWVDAFFAPEAEEAAANELIDAGADVVWSSTDTQIAMQVAQQRGAGAAEPVYALGNDNPNACDYAPEICITTPYWNWGPVLVRQIAGMLDGTWDYRDLIWEGIKGDAEESMIYLAPVNPAILPTANLEVEALIQRMAQGELDPFDGPLKDNAGAVRVPEGERVSDDDALRMCWFVEGIFEPGAAHQPATVPPLCDGIR
jgi:basic membrane protein A